MTVGQFIGYRFKLEELIGQGGMGEVYRGMDSQTGEAVAVKVLKPEVLNQDPDLLERFEREAEALRRLDHPNIVKIVAMVKDQDRHYIVMEYIQGGALSDLLKKDGALPLQRALEIALDLADALTRAHRLKIIHRDIKPPNVLLAEDGTPRLTDFGVARMEDRTRMTETGSLIGTYAYLSPEVCNGQEADERSDLWAFGVMLYEMLAGQRPFTGATPANIILNILTQEPTDLAALRLDAPPSLLALVGQLLMKDRAQRLESARQVGAELESILRRLRSGQSEPLPATPSRFESSPSIPMGLPTAPVQTPYLISKAEDSPTLTPALSQKKPLSWPLRAWLALLLAVFVIVAYFYEGLRGFFESDSPPPPAASLCGEVAPVEAQQYMVLVADFAPLGQTPPRNVARFIREDLTRQLEGITNFSNLRVRACPAPLTSNEQAALAAEQTGATFVVWGDYDAEAVQAYIQVGDLEKFPYNTFPRETLERLANLRLGVTDERRESLSEYILSSLGILQIADGDTYNMLTTLALLDLLETTPASLPDQNSAASIAQSLQVYVSDPAQGILFLDRAIELDRANPVAYVMRASTRSLLGDTALGQLDVETARRLGDERWALPPTVEAHLDFSDTGDYARQIPFYTEALALRPNDWYLYNYRAANYYVTGQYDLARADYDQALALGPNAVFPYPFSILLALRTGEMQRVTTLLETMFQRFPDTSLGLRMTEVIGVDEYIWGPLFSGFGNMVAGQYADALQDFEQVIALQPEFSDGHALYGLSLCNLERLEEAESAYDRALELEPDVAWYYMLRADVRTRQGKITEGLADVGQARSFNLGSEFEDFIQRGLRGEVTCRDLFTYAP